MTRIQTLPIFDKGLRSQSVVAVAIIGLKQKNIIKFRGGKLMKPKKKCYDQESYELDNIYNEEMDHRGDFLDSSIYYS